jgi:carboxypeptidase family protein
MNFRNKLQFIVLGLIMFFCALSGRAQSSGNIQGVVKDPSGGILVGATVEITNPATAYHRETVTGAAGDFRFTNIPFNPYHLVVSAKGFANYTQDVDVRSSVPVALDISVALGTATENITVEATAGDLVETESTYHTDVDRALFDKLPLESASSSLSSLVTLSTPGVAADSNGLFHGLGDHASNSFSVDGQAITDQQSKVFSNQVPEDSIQSLEVISGAPPAEYGGKTSLVIVATTRSGLGETEPHGQVTASYGSFGSSNGGFNLAFGSNTLGNFISANGLNTARFLDGPELGVQHDRGNEQNIFDRVDYKASPSDTVSLNFNYSRSWFQTPNSYDAQYGTEWTINSAGPAICPVGQIGSCGVLGPNGLPVGPADQRSKIGTFNIAPSWTHLINTNTVFTLGAFVRRDQYNYYPSSNPFADAAPALQTSTVGQSRSLLNAGARASLSYVKGINNMKAGVTFEHTFLTENDKYGIVDPTVNAVCLNADGSPDTNPALTNPTQCTGALSPNNAANNALLGATIPAFTPLLGCYDLTRTAALPVSDGCPAGQTTSGLYSYYGHTDIKETALFFQDTLTIKNWSFNLGLRADIYNGLTSAKQLEPRLGIAYNIKPTNTVLRVSYARTMESPFNENLIIASTGCSNPVIFDFQLDVAGASCSSSSVPPLSPGKRNEFHAGLEQAFGKYLVIDGEYIWKYTTRAFDFSVLDNTPITYPIEWASSKIPGYAIRVSVPNLHGFTAYTVMSSVAARFFGPQISGVGATPGIGYGVFRIDHDERFNQTTHVQYQPGKKLPWVGFTWRYDSGLVAGALPCAGDLTNCANGPNGSDTVVDVSGLTPDQQFQAGLYCSSSFATPNTPLSSSLGANLCPAANYGSKFLKIPAPGTENDDHNPPRVAPRNLFDVSVGDDNLFHKDRYKWSLRLTAINVTNKVAVYNFLSTFSGTHYVTPRAMTAELGFHF